MAALAAAAVALHDAGGLTDAPGGGDLGDLNDAARAAARFRLTRAATIAAGRLAAGRPAAPPAAPAATSSSVDDLEAARTASHATTHGTSARPPPWYRHRPALLAIAAYATSATVFCLVDELLPLYASASVATHGLGLSTQGLSVAMAASGVFLILTASFVYPPLQDRLGLAGILGWGLVVGFVMCVPFYPLAYRVTVAALAAAWTPHATRMAVQAMLWTAGLLYATSYNFTNTSTQLLVNLAAPEGAIGAVNGAGNMMSALARIVAPMLAAALWGAASQESVSSLPLQWLPYLVSGSVFLLGRLAMWALRVTDERMLGVECGERGERRRVQS
jgi:hypothetical protein